MIRFKTSFSSLVFAFLLMQFSVPAFAQQNGKEWQHLSQKLTHIKASWHVPPRGIVGTKLTTGMLLGNGDIGVVAGDTINRQKFYFGKSDFWGSAVKTPNAEQSVWQESILSAGGLTISSPEQSADPAKVFYMEQDILNAEVKSTIQFGKAKVNMSSWTTDATGKYKNLFICQFVSDKTVTINANLWMPSTYKYGGKVSDCIHIYPYSSGVSNGELWVSRRNNLNPGADPDHAGNYQAEVATAAALVNAKFNHLEKNTGQASGSFTLKAGVPVYLVVRFESNKTTNGSALLPVVALTNKAIQTIKNLTIGEITILKNEHRRWWKNYWLKSYVDLNDTTYERFYYGSLYMLGCSSRAGSPPPSLFGNWITTDLSSWGGRYFLNYNEEAAYYGVCSSNRPDLVLPYSDLILNEKTWQRNKTHAAGYDGVCHQRSLTPYHLFTTLPAAIPVASQKDYKKLPADQKSNGVFAVMPLVWYYEYSQDTNYLRTKLYPYLKELAAFYMDYMDKSKKPYVIEHSSAHEGSDDINPNLDIGFCRRVCQTLINSSKVLNVDAQMRPVWQDVLNNLSDYPTIIRNGKVVYVESATKNGSTDPLKLFHPGDQPINLEGGVFPGENIYLGGDTAQLRIARESLDQLGGWCINTKGSEHNGFPKEWPIAARIGWPADDLFEKLKQAIKFHWRNENLTAFQGGGGIETAGAIEGINSLLMQSEGGVIRLFPEWPLSKDASFVRLRAKGAFLVSSAIENSKISWLRISSEKGLPVVIKNPWPNKAIKVYNNRHAAISYRLVNGNIVFDTKTGSSYEIKGV